MTTIFALLAVGAGACIALQASANGTLGRFLDSRVYAAFFSICGTCVVTFTAMLAARPAAPSWEAVRTAPWWAWVGGPLGLMVVAAGAFLTRELGAALFIALVVGGQLLCSLVLDHYALMGLQEQPVTPGRLLGAALVVAGVLCIKYL
ncbi:MAG: EamA-like transporter family protein [Isosphaera sp.]|nr:EamA-like transporter family protein [Isosphaera sp.]